LRIIRRYLPDASKESGYRFFSIEFPSVKFSGPGLMSVNVTLHLHSKKMAVLEDRDKNVVTIKTVNESMKILILELALLVDARLHGVFF
jgi:hypothetical protein